jgi:hypothetical protein
MGGFIHARIRCHARFFLESLVLVLKIQDSQTLGVWVFKKSLMQPTITLLRVNRKGSRTDAFLFCSEIGTIYFSNLAREMIY